MNVLLLGAVPVSAQPRIRAVFPPECCVRFATDAQAAEGLADTEVLIPEHAAVDRALLDRMTRLRLIQTGAGYDNVDLTECARRGVAVCCGKGVNADAVAEHTLALILGWYKNLPLLDSFMRSCRDESALCYQGAELAGRTVGVVGLGTIGRRVARLCGAFGMHVLGFRRSGAKEDGVSLVPLEELLERSDVVTLHVPLCQETFHLIDKAALARMKPTALLVNTARGPVVDEAALTRALESRSIAGACLDVFEREPLPPDSPLRALPNVILTPHTAGFPDGTKFHQRRYAFFAENVQRLLRGQPLNGLLESGGARNG